MLSKLRAEQEKEEGFTLIELLVVVIIIGILAAIAIPVFLNQRTKAWDSAAKSDVKNMATAEETYLTDHSVYTSDVTQLTGTGVGFKKSANVTHCAAGTLGNSYVVAAKHNNSVNYWYFDSSTGVLAGGTSAPTGCTSFS